MAVTETAIKNQCNMKINVGTGTDGTITTKSQSLGTLSLTASDWDATKAMNIIEALGLCLSRGIYEVQHVVTNRVESDE